VRQILLAPWQEVVLMMAGRGDLIYSSIYRVTFVGGEESESKQKIHSGLGWS
jgi:hypothetical protein